MPVPTIADMLGDLAKSPPPPMTEEERQKSELNALSDDEKWARAWQFRMRGVPVRNIGKMFGVDIRTIYRWFARLKQQFREVFEQETSADLLVEFILEIDDQIATVRYDIVQLEQDGKKFDPATGAVTENDDKFQVIGARQRYQKHLADLTKMKMDLLLQTGVIPKEPERMYHTLEQEGKVFNENEQTEKVGDRDHDTDVAELLDKMTKGRVLS